MLLISGTYERTMKICHCLKVDFGAFALSLIAILFSHLVDFSNHFLSSLKSVSSSSVSARVAGVLNGWEYT